MSAGQASYYVELAREDYYLAGGEPPGTWLGEGCKALQLSGQVSQDEFYNLFAGRRPDGSADLIQRQHHKGKAEHRAGWDLTFSAPKSVSALWAISNPDARERIECAHAKAIGKAIDFLGIEAAETRRGKGGHITEKAKLVVALFEHGTSRALDPQLHSHALVLNVCVREDGTTGALSSPLLFRYKMAAGALYRAELQSSLRETLGVQTSEHDSLFEVIGVPEEVTEAFSKRRKEILEAIQKTGVISAKGVAALTLETRSVKESLPRQELFTRWQEEAQRLGWGEEQAKSLLGVTLAPGAKVGVAEQRTDADGPSEQAILDKVSIFQRCAEEAISNVQSADEAIQRATKSLERFSEIGGQRVALRSFAHTEHQLERALREGQRNGPNGIGITGHPSRIAELNEQASTLRFYGADDFLERLRNENKRKLDEIKALNLAPDVLQPVRSFLQRYGPNLGQLSRYGPDLSQLVKFGPDVTEVFRSLEKLLFKGVTQIGNADFYIIDSPEAIRTFQLIEILTYAKLRAISVHVVRETQAAAQRELKEAQAVQDRHRNQSQRA